MHSNNPLAHIGIISPASPSRRAFDLNRAVTLLEGLGSKVTVGKGVGARAEYLAGDNKTRLTDLHAMYRDKSITAIWCLRGGYGSGQLLSKINYDLIKKSDKNLIGFSDITALLSAIWRRARCRSFHGPVITSFLDDYHFDDSVYESLVAALTKRKSSITQFFSNASDDVEVLKPGKAEGVLIGGNLMVLSSLVGTPFFPSLKGAIFFLEEVGDTPMRVDRNLTQLLHSKVLDGIKGIAIGWCQKVNDLSLPKDSEYHHSIVKVIAERLSSLKVPIIAGLPFGHIRQNATIPFGAKGILNSKNKELIIWA